MFDRQLAQGRLLIGIGGNIGSGKTTVANELRRYGAKVIDADSLSRSLLRKGTPEYDKLIHAFGREILKRSGEIDRKILAKKAFASPAALKKLNRIMHPPLLKKIREEIDSVREGLVVVDAALLFACGLHREMDVAILVTAPDELRLARLRRSGMSLDDARQRLELQGPDTRFWGEADFVLENCGSRAELKRKIRALWNYFYSGRIVQRPGKRPGAASA